MSIEKRTIILPGLLVLGALAALALVAAKAANVVLGVDEASLSGTKTVKRSSRAVMNESAQSAPAHNEPVNGQLESNDEPIQVEVITIRADGFEPSEIIRPHGHFILAINNHTGVDELSLHLDRVSGNRVHEVRMRKGRVRWNQVFNLPPGDYLLNEQNHPDWVCRIKLTAR